jgi:O-antigen biosynthesis protein WbqP
LLKDPNKYVTNFGKFLRKTSLDELPQLYSVLNGQMSLVGPRPALFNQNYLIKKRKFFKIDKLKPGITGYAQINGRDDISIKEKIKLEYFYLKNKSIKLDLMIILLTISKIINPKNISH